jgi:hypothetical protein
MKTINLKEIIEKGNLDTNEVASHLFPGNSYPRLALNRILTGKAVLDADQISKLSMFASIPIDQLYDKWKASYNNTGVHTFTYQDFIAYLDTNTWITQIFHGESMFHESVIHSGSIKLSEFLNNINIQIQNFNDGKNKN